MKTPMDEVYRIAAEFVAELRQATPEDFQHIKIQMLAYYQDDMWTFKFLQRVFAIAEQMRPLLIEMK